MSGPGVWGRCSHQAAVGAQEAVQTREGPSSALTPPLGAPASRPPPSAVGVGIVWDQPGGRSVSGSPAPPQPRASPLYRWEVQVLCLQVGADAQAWREEGPQGFRGHCSSGESRGPGQMPSAGGRPNRGPAQTERLLSTHQRGKLSPCLG